VSRTTSWFLGALLLAPLALVGLPGPVHPTAEDPAAPETPESAAVDRAPLAALPPAALPAPGVAAQRPPPTPPPKPEGQQGEEGSKGGDAGDSGGDEEQGTEETGGETGEGTPPVEEPPATQEPTPAPAEQPASTTGTEPPAPTPASGAQTETGAADQPAADQSPVNQPPGEGSTASEGPPADEPPPGAVDPTGAVGVPATEPGAAAPTTATGAPAAEPVAPPAAPARPPLPPLVPAYRSLVDTTALLDAFAASAPGPVRRFELGRSFEGQIAPALEFGAPGPRPLQERPTVFLIGGLDGRSLAGGEAVLSVVHELLARPDRLPENVAFIAVPWASPGPLSRVAAGPGDGRDARPTDDDRDGKFDEDGPDDLDGDGMVLDMLIEDPEGPWARGGDGRFLVPARPGDGARYLWTREGRDDDGDGSFNEDPPGGVVLDRNFPVHREGPWQDPTVGQLPMSEPLVRALADLAFQRRTVVVLLFQGHHGAVATPNEAAPEDAPVWRRVTEAFLAATGRTQPGPLTLQQARGAPCPGAGIDWFHEVLGALSLEVAAWGPGVEGASTVSVQSAQFATSGSGEAPRALEGRPRLGDRENAWAAWLDNTRGGLGFVDWQPVELGNGRLGLVGGWQPFTIENPPPESLAGSLHGLPDFVADLAASLPRLEIRANSSRDGDLCRVSAQIKNLGLLPSGLEGGRRAARTAPLSLDLQLPPGAQLVAGELHVELDRLLAHELSRSISWVVVAPAGSVLRLSANSAWTGTVEREVKP